VVVPRLHRTTGRVIGEAWAEERSLLVPIPASIAAQVTGQLRPLPQLALLNAVAGHQAGDHVEIRPLDTYEVAM
jgi:hypothetical protein